MRLKKALAAHGKASADDDKKSRQVTLNRKIEEYRKKKGKGVVFTPSEYRCIQGRCFLDMCPYICMFGIRHCHMLDMLHVWIHGNIHDVTSTQVEQHSSSRRSANSKRYRGENHGARCKRQASGSASNPQRLAA